MEGFIKNLIKKYSFDSFLLILPGIASALIAFIVLPIILRSLPTKDYGIFQFVLAWQALLIVLTGSHISSGAIKGIARGLSGTFLFAFFARLKLLVPIGIFVLVISFYFIFLKDYIFSALLAIIGVYLLFGVSFQTSFTQFLIAKKKFKEWCFWQILFSFVSMVGSAIVACLTKNIVFFALFQLGSIIILSWIGWFLAVKKEKLIKSYKKGEIDKECVPYGLKLIPVDLVSITAGKISHFIIGPFFGFSSLAVFSVANKLRDKCMNLTRVTVPSLLYADFAKKERKELIKIINRHLVKIGILGVVLSLIFLVAGWLYIIFFLPKIFHQITIYLAILLLGLPAGMMVMVLHTVLESHLRYKELTVIGIIPNLLKIVLILLFGYFWKIIGVCFALAISGWISFGFYYLLTIKKDLAIKILKKFPFLLKLVQKY